MFARQKLVLATLWYAPRQPRRTELTKWLFLLRQEADEGADSPAYDFVPHKYGPFSFMLYRDLDDLIRKGYLRQDALAFDPLLKAQVRSQVGSLHPRLVDSIRSILNRFADLNQTALLDYVYSRHGWFASRSEIRPVPRTARASVDAIYTAGYEGKSIDSFLNGLLRASVERVLDVRRNPMSRKYGFSGRSLQRVCGRVGIDYAHMPELGVPAAMRVSLKTRADYERVLRHYEVEFLPRVPGAVSKARALVAERRTALVCFEENPDYCHRTRLAARMSCESGMPVIHLT